MILIGTDCSKRCLAAFAGMRNSRLKQSHTCSFWSWLINRLKIHLSVETLAVCWWSCSVDFKFHSLKNSRTRNRWPSYWWFTIQLRCWSWFVRWLKLRCRKLASISWLDRFESLNSSLHFSYWFSHRSIVKRCGAATFATPGPTFVRQRQCLPDRIRPNVSGF